MYQMISALDIHVLKKASNVRNYNFLRQLFFFNKGHIFLELKEVTTIYETVQMGKND